MAKSNLPFELPEWFSYKRYKNTDSYGAFEWGRELRLRHFLKESFKVFEEKGESRDKICKDFLQFMKSAFIAHDRMTEHIVFHKTPSLRFVRPVTNGNIAYYWKLIGLDPKVEKFREYLSGGGCPEDEREQEEYWAMYDASIGLNDSGVYNPRFEKLSSSSVLAMVDLSRPERLLVEDFKQFLNDNKPLLSEKLDSKKYGSGKFTAGKFKSWSQGKVLPYIDLTLIADAHGKKVEYLKMGAELFPDEYEVDLVGKVRQSTRVMAVELMNEDVVRELESQGLREKSV